MLTPTPEDRACLEWACRVVFGIDSGAEIIVLRDLTVVWDAAPFKIDPANSAVHASIATLAQMMKLHIGGVGFGELRDDLLRSGVGEKFANRVHDHLVDVSVEEWGQLGRRVETYRHMQDFKTTVSGA